MRAPATYGERFDFGRLGIDVVRVFARAWPQIALGLLVLGVAPTTIAALPWWVSPTYSRSFPGIWTIVTVAKAALNLVASAAVAAFMTGASLKVLMGQSWPWALQPGRLAAGFVTAFALRLFVNWATLVSPLAAVYAPVDDVRWMLLLSVPLSLVVSVAAAGLAVPVAVAGPASVGAAVADSFRLLHGLRWRIVSLCLAYLVAVTLGQIVAGLVLGVLQISYVGPGAGRAAISMAPVLSGALLDVAFAAFLLQARRIADGPGERELKDVFG